MLHHLTVICSAAGVAVVLLHALEQILLAVGAAGGHRHVFPSPAGGEVVARGTPDLVLHHLPLGTLSAWLGSFP